MPRYLLWIQTEIAIIGSDIQEVIGSAIALNILSRGYMPLWAGVIVTSLDCFIFLYVEQGGEKYPAVRSPSRFARISQVPGPGGMSTPRTPALPLARQEAPWVLPLTFWYANRCRHPEAGNAFWFFHFRHACIFWLDVLRFSAQCVGDLERAFHPDP